MSPSWWRTWAEYRTETFQFSRIDYAIRRIRIGDTVKTLGARRQCASPPGHCAMVACATAGGACLRATCRAVKAKHGRDERGKRRGGAAARACTCVRCGRGGGSPAVCAERLYTPLVMRGGRGAHRTHGTACWVWGSPPLRHPVFARSSHRPANAATLTRKHAAAHGSTRQWLTGSRQPVSAGRTRFARGGQAGRPHRGGGRSHPDAWAKPARWAAGWRRLRPSDAAARSAAGPGRVTAP